MTTMNIWDFDLKRNTMFLTASALGIALTSSSCSPVPEVGSPPVVKSGHTWQTSIDSKTWWNYTGITVRKGHSYRFHVSGVWYDAYARCTPQGPVSPLIRAYGWPIRWALRFTTLRDPNAVYFIPIGTIGRGEKGHLPDNAFIIRDNLVWQAPATGVLHTFANDWIYAYGNNHGSIQLTVTEERSCPISDSSSIRRLSQNSNIHLWLQETYPNPMPSPMPGRDGSDRRLGALSCSRPR